MNNVISLFGHRAARARNQTHLGHVEYACKALLKHGRLYLSVHAPGATLTEQWLRSLLVDVSTDEHPSCTGRIERLDRQDGPFYLLVSTVLDPMPKEEVRTGIRCTLRTACGTFSLHDVAGTHQTASI